MRSASLQQRRQTTRVTGVQLTSGAAAKVKTLIENEEGDLFLRLAPGFDIVCENFKAGTADRLGIGYDDVAAGAVVVATEGPVAASLLDLASLPMERNTSCIAGARPISDGISPGTPSVPARELPPIPSQ